MVLYRRLATAIVLFFPLMIVCYIGLLIVGSGFSGLVAGAPVRDPNAAYDVGFEIGSEYARNNGWLLLLGSVLISILLSILLSFRNIFPWCRTDIASNSGPANIDVAAMAESSNVLPPGESAAAPNDKSVFTENSGGKKSQPVQSGGIGIVSTAILSLLLTVVFYFGFITFGSLGSGMLFKTEPADRWATKQPSQSSGREFKQENGWRILFSSLGLSVLLSVYLSHRGWNLIAPDNKLFPHDRLDPKPPSGEKEVIVADLVDHPTDVAPGVSDPLEQTAPTKLDSTNDSYEAPMTNDENDKSFFTGTRPSKTTAPLHPLPTTMLILILLPLLFFGIIFIGSFCAGVTTGARYTEPDLAYAAAQDAARDFVERYAFPIFLNCSGLSVILGLYLSYRGWNFLVPDNRLVPGARQSPVAPQSIRPGVSDTRPKQRRIGTGQRGRATADRGRATAGHDSAIRPRAGRSAGPTCQT